MKRFIVLLASLLVAYFHEKNPVKTEAGGGTRHYSVKRCDAVPLSIDKGWELA